MRLRCTPVPSFLPCFCLWISVEWSPGAEPWSSWSLTEPSPAWSADWAPGVGSCMSISPDTLQVPYTSMAPSKLSLVISVNTLCFLSSSLPVLSKICDLLLIHKYSHCVQVSVHRGRSTKFPVCKNEVTKVGAPVSTLFWTCFFLCLRFNHNEVVRYDAWCLKMLMRQVEVFKACACSRVKWGVNAPRNLVCCS